MKISLLRVALMSIAAVAMLASVTMPTFAAFDPSHAATQELAAPLATPPEHELTVCPLAIVEDRTTCQFAVMAGVGCAADIAPVITAFGARLLASPEFLAACFGTAPKDGHGPPG